MSIWNLWMALDECDMKGKADGIRAVASIQV